MSVTEIYKLIATKLNVNRAVKNNEECDSLTENDMYLEMQDMRTFSDYNIKILCLSYCKKQDLTPFFFGLPFIQKF